MGANKVTVLLVDDHHVLRDGLKALLEIEQDIEIIGEAATGQEAIDLSRSLQPDIIIMDLGLPDMSGFKAIELIRAEHVELRIVVLSMHVQREFVVKAIELGCNAYVPKSTTHDSLLESIRVVRAGGTYLHPLAASALVESMTIDQTDANLFSQLTNREQEVIRHTVMGFTSREIGKKLIISSKTVDTHRQRAFQKLGIDSRADLMKFAIKAGIIGNIKSADL